MKQKGFTLIEVLIVVAIIGIILAVVLPNIGQFLGNGTSLYVPTFGQGYVITNAFTNESYQLRGQQSFEIAESTIAFIPSYRNPPFDKEDVIFWNGNWTLCPGIK